MSSESSETACSLRMESSNDASRTPSQKARRPTSLNLETITALKTSPSPHLKKPPLPPAVLSPVIRNSENGAACSLLSKPPLNRSPPKGQPGQRDLRVGTSLSQESSQDRPHIIASTLNDFSGQGAEPEKPDDKDVPCKDTESLEVTRSSSLEEGHPPVSSPCSPDLQVRERSSSFPERGFTRKPIRKPDVSSPSHSPSRPTSWSLLGHKRRTSSPGPGSPNSKNSTSPSPVSPGKTHHRRGSDQDSSSAFFFPGKQRNSSPSFLLRALSGSLLGKKKNAVSSRSPSTSGASSPGLEGCQACGSSVGHEVVCVKGTFYHPACVACHV
ncbi:hypothetical protein ACOMHN_066497 [Nucella lapillus]